MDLEILGLLQNYILQNLRTAATVGMQLIFARDVSWLLVSFLAFLRRSEARALLMTDLSLFTSDKPRVEVRIRKSKTGFLQRGV